MVFQFLISYENEKNKSIKKFKVKIFFNMKIVNPCTESAVQYSVSNWNEKGHFYPFQFSLQFATSNFY